MTARFDAWLMVKLPEWFTSRVALWLIAACGFELWVGGA